MKRLLEKVNKNLKVYFQRPNSLEKKSLYLLFKISLFIAIKSSHLRFNILNLSKEVMLGNKIVIALEF